MTIAIFLTIGAEAADTLGRWFYTNAPAAWISATVAIGSLLYVLRSRKKPRRIVVREAKKVSLVQVWPSVRDEIAMTFHGQPITNLGQVDLEIFNEGSDVVERPGILVTLPDKATIIGTLLNRQDAQATAEIQGSKVLVRLPYLNPYSDHKQLVTLSMLVDGSTEHVTAVGDGAGWSTRHVPLPTMQQLRRRSRFATTVFGLAMLFIVAYGFYLQKAHGIGCYDLSLRALLWQLPGFIFFAIAGVWFVRVSDDRSKRSLRRSC